MPMSTTWASKISWILSPTRSYIACMSSSAARPCWTPLMIASSAARSSVSVSSRFVSSNRRAFSSATPMLEASVLSSRSSASPNASRSIAFEADHPDDPLAGHDRHAEPRLGRGPAELDRPAARSPRRPMPTRSGSAGADDDRGQAIAQLDAGPRRSAGPRRRSYGNEMRSVAASYSAMNDGRGLEDRPDPLADELDDRREVELLGEGAADLVDDRQLGGALIGLGEEPLRLVEQPGVLERDAHARGERARAAARRPRRTRTKPRPRRTMHAEDGRRRRGSERPSHEFEMAPASTAPSSVPSSSVSRRSGLRVRMTIEVRPVAEPQVAPTGSARHRSISYGNEIVPAGSS